MASLAAAPILQRAQPPEEKAAALPPLPDKEEEEGEVLLVRASVVRRQLDSVAVTWEPTDRRSARCRACARQLAPATLETSVHCRRCGGLFCRRCRLRRAVLPGHESGAPAPVCARCHAALAREAQRDCEAEEEVACEDEDQATDAEDDEELIFRDSDCL